MSHQTTPFGLRMPDKLRREVRALASREGRSMNNQIVRVLQAAIEAEKSASAPSA